MVESVIRRIEHYNRLVATLDQPKIVTRRSVDGALLIDILQLILQHRLLQPRLCNFLLQRTDLCFHRRLDGAALHIANHKEQTERDQSKGDQPAIAANLGAGWSRSEVVCRHCRLFSMQYSRL